MKIQNLIKNYGHFLLLFILTIGFLSFFYGKILIHPNSYIFTSSGDGIKNYYTYAYFIKNNQSSINFEGMNYPYYENFMFSDSHPLLALFLQKSSHLFPVVADYSIGILNLLMILSIGLTVFILFFIFRLLKINPLLNIFAAIGITILSPQIFRINGHLSLSYSFVIPLILYLLLLYESTLKKKYLFFLAISTVVFFFTHAYLGMEATLLIFTYSTISLIVCFFSKLKINKSRYISLFITTLLPVIIFYVFVSLTDFHKGRTTNPWGIFENHAQLSTIFLPVDNPTDIIKNYLFPKINQSWEGWAFIGFATIIILLIYLIKIFLKIIKNKKLKFTSYIISNQPLRILFASSILILAFSMFVPFRFGLEKYVDYINIIKQFRSLGRFAWIFYFISTITSVYLLNVYIQRLIVKNKHFISCLIIFIYFAMMFFDGIFYHIDISDKICSTPNYFDIQQNPSTLKNDIVLINPLNYQAILPFPFYHIGSENYSKPAINQILFLSTLYSYHLNLPLISSCLARTSIPESKNIMQLLASRFYKKNIEADISKEKLILIIALNEGLNINEIEYLKEAHCISKNDTYSIYEINPQVFFRNTSNEEIAKFKLISDSLYKKNGFLVNDTSFYFSYKKYNSYENETVYSDTSQCLSGYQKDYVRLFVPEKNKLKVGKKYIARFWMYNNGKNFGQDCLSGMIFFESKTNNKVQWLEPIINAGNSYEINGNWSLVEISFINNDTNAVYDLIYKGPDYSNKKVYFDGILFYDSDLRIYNMNEQVGYCSLFYNNHRISCIENQK